jgi:hypothetical protein
MKTLLKFLEGLKGEKRIPVNLWWIITILIIVIIAVIEHKYLNIHVSLKEFNVDVNANSK